MLLEERQTPNKGAAMRRFVIRPLEAFDLIASKPEHEMTLWFLPGLFAVSRWASWGRSVNCRS
jgi:hypothetical protein